MRVCCINCYAAHLATSLVFFIQSLWPQNAVIGLMKFKLNQKELNVGKNAFKNGSHYYQLRLLVSFYSE